jgi:hypothetical protein
MATYSEDGQWMWDGSEWIPAPPSHSPPAQRASPRHEPPTSRARSSGPSSPPPRTTLSDERRREIVNESVQNAMSGFRETVRSEITQNDPEYNRYISWREARDLYKESTQYKVVKLSTILIFPMLILAVLTINLGGYISAPFWIITIILALVILSGGDDGECIVETIGKKKVYKCSFCGWEPQKKWYQSGERTLIHKHWKKMEHTERLLAIEVKHEGDLRPGWMRWSVWKWNKFVDK